MVASLALHRARHQQMSFIRSRLEAPAISSLPQIAPHVELEVALHEGPDPIDSRLIRNGIRDAAKTLREVEPCIDVIASPAALRGSRGSSLQDATLISLSGVFPFTSGLLGFISALAAARLVAAGVQRLLLRSERIRVDAHMDNALSFDGLPIAPLGACRPSVHSASTGRALTGPPLASSISCQLGFSREMSWKLVNDALLA